MSCDSILSKVTRVCVNGRQINATIKQIQGGQKLALFRTAGLLQVRGKIRLPKVEHSKSEGHVTLNKDKKSVQLKI